MPFSITPVQPADVDFLVRKVDDLAHRDGLLYLLIFPCPAQREQREDEIRWLIDELLETVDRGDETPYKACGKDGLPLGLIGWTNCPNTAKDTTKSASEQVTKVNNRSSWTPSSLDLAAWRGVSKRLREERQRVLQSCHNSICRITFMSVTPEYQRQGVGSALMEMFCRHVDENALDAFVMASPAGVCLYSKFGFKAVGVVEAEKGNFTSMLRTG